MSQNNLKHDTVKGLFWSSVERFSVQGVSFVVMLVIARILSPADYGLVGMLSIFMAIAQCLIDSGFSNALIRKQDRTDVDNNTVFYFNLVVSLGLYGILFGIAPWVADFYNEPILKDLMRLLCLTVVIGSLAVVQRADYTARLDFKTQARASFAAAVVSGIVGIILAIKGYGAWTIVWQQIASATVSTLLLWYYASWYPKMQYSWESFREMFGYGSKLMASSLLDTTYNNIYPIVIGKIFSAQTLGFYTRAQNFAQLPSSNITGIIQRVTFPVLSKLQDDDERLQRNYRKLLKMSAFIIFPMMCILAAVSKPLIVILIGKKWVFCSVLLIPICFDMMWYPIHAINLNLLQVKGRSDLFLRLEIVKKVLGVLVLCISIPFGIIAMCYASIGTSLLSLVINTYYTGKLINVGFLRQMHDLSVTLILALLTFALVYLGGNIVSNDWLWLIGGLIIGLSFYLGIAFIIKSEDLQTTIEILKNTKK
jgi:O-antigen/teichoic acid export membrane protein